MPVPDAARFTTIQGLIEQIRGNTDRPVILTEGDSWFSFPLHRNTIDHLQHMANFSVLRLEKGGDNLLRMLDEKRLKKLRKRISQIFLRRSARNFRAQALLMSGGGNDLLGTEMVDYLRSNAAGAQATDFIEIDRARAKLAQLGIAYDQLCWHRDDSNPDCVIYAHGYDYAIPGNRPVTILWGLKKFGPWMHRAMSGEVDPSVVVPPEHRRAVARWFVDELAGVLTATAARNQNFVHVDVRGQIADDEWNDEIHPERSGFAKVSSAILAALRVQFPAL